MKKILLLISAFFVINLQAEVVTTTKTQSATGEGSGITREEAVNNAIIEAIGKISGVKINSLKLSSTRAISDSSSANITDTYSEQINKATKGRVDTYEINSVEQDSSGKFIASVTVKNTKTTKRYKAPGLDSKSRRSIAVFHSGANYGTLGANLQQRIVTELNRSRKFNALDRDSSSYYEAEKQLISSGNAAKDEIYKLGNVLGADYMLLFAINDAQVSAKTSNLTGKTKTKASVLIEYRILLFATRQIKFSNSLALDIDLKDNNIKGANDMLNTIAARIAGDVLNSIYPLKVAEINGQEIVFSQTLNVGDTYECFTQGKAIEDAYTKETTGRIENKIGTIEITRATPKISYGKITEGNVKKGDICRPATYANVGGFSDAQGKSAEYELDQSGGVKLGW